MEFSMTDATPTPAAATPDADRLPFPYRPEAEVVADSLAALHGALDWVAAARVAAPWVQAVRDQPPPFWAVDSLLKEYPISSAEGLALMRLAEALLRVPDAETAIALTADQLGRADFDAAGDSTLARLSSSAIALSKKFLPGTPGGAQAAQEPGLVARLGARTVVAATLRAVQLLGRQFVLGQTIEEGMAEADGARRRQPNLSYSYDMLGEGARTDADALQHLASYQNAIQKIASSDHPTLGIEQKDGISIKLSALHPRYEAAQHARVMRELVPRVWSLCERAARANVGLTIDAEEVDRLELSLDVFEALVAQVAQHFPQWRGFGLALQAYQTRALPLIEHIIGLARRYRLRFMCRLVKGAYWDAEIKRAQELGLPHYPVFTHKHHTDVSYLACARALLAAPDAIYPQFATHNAGTIAAILQMAARPAGVDASGGNGGVGGRAFGAGQGGAREAGGGHGAERAASHPGSDPDSTSFQGASPRFELQRLHGMSEGTYREVLKNPLVACRVYAPVGAHRDLLAYLVRRLLENGANSSFVHQLADASVALDELLVSPLHLAPNPSLPLPPDLFGPGRKNSAGLDLAVAAMRAPLLQALDTVQVPVVAEFDVKTAPSQRDLAQVCYQQWSKVPVAERAAALRRAADALQQQLPRFCALLVREAFKTWGDAVAEVREAVDFLRYYAAEAERLQAPVALPGPTGESNELHLGGRGVWVCISPWNFPLAIFMGQVAAALATGNTVLAKPAEQTPGVAWEAVRLLHAAGVPGDAVQLLARSRRDSGRGAGGAAGHRGCGLHRLHRRGAAHQPRAGGQGRAHRAADRRDRRYQRHGGRQHRAARAGGGRGGAERLPLGRPTLLGAAPAVPARRHRRRRDRDDPGCGEGAGGGRPGRAGDRCRPGDRSRGLRGHPQAPATAEFRVKMPHSQRKMVTRCYEYDTTCGLRSALDCQRAAGNLRPGAAYRALEWRPAGGHRADQCAGLWPHAGHPDPH
jgi:RHH-type proline utilization regulon transcriptional repressor/proline dehydrogenase/delta 1-pyrroline-5-carboxylate dehydrogenase